MFFLYISCRINVASCPTDKLVSFTISCPYIRCEAYWGATSIWVNTFNQLCLDCRIHIQVLSKIFSRWDSIQWTYITPKVKETCIFYNRKRLRIHRYHFDNPLRHLLMLWMIKTPCILLLLYFGQCELLCISFSLLYLAFFVLFICCFISNSLHLSLWALCKWYHKLLVLKFLVDVPPRLIDSLKVLHTSFVESFGSAK